MLRAAWLTVAAPGPAREFKERARKFYVSRRWSVTVRLTAVAPALRGLAESRITREWCVAHGRAAKAAQRACMSVDMHARAHACEAPPGCSF